jgi:DNA-binding CsgD family transcriptional regulator
MNPGDAGSIVESFCERCYSPVVSYASWTRTKSANVAKDTFQVAFLARCSAPVSGGSVRRPEGGTHCLVRCQVIRPSRHAARRRSVCSTLCSNAATAPADAPGYRHVESRGLLSLLTSREAENLQLRSRPMRYSGIAESLNISLSTVKTLLARAVRKMQEGARGHYPEFRNVSRGAGAAIGGHSPRSRAMSSQVSRTQPGSCASVI